MKKTTASEKNELSELRAENKILKMKLALKKTTSDKCELQVSELRAENEELKQKLVGKKTTSEKSEPSELQKDNGNLKQRITLLEAYVDGMDKRLALLEEKSAENNRNKSSAKPASLGVGDSISYCSKPCYKIKDKVGKISRVSEDWVWIEADDGKTIRKHRKSLQSFTFASPPENGLQENTELRKKENAIDVTMDDNSIEAEKKPPVALLEEETKKKENTQNDQNKLIEFPKLSFRNFVLNWHCGDPSRNVPPYRLLRPKDVVHFKHGRHKLNQMRYLIRHVYRAAEYVNLPHLIVTDWTPSSALELYNATKHMFFFPGIRTNKTRTYETIAWKTYYNLVAKRKGQLMGEPKKEIQEKTTKNTETDKGGLSMGTF